MLSNDRERVAEQLERLSGRLFRRWERGRAFFEMSSLFLRNPNIVSSNFYNFVPNAKKKSK